VGVSGKDVFAQVREFIDQETRRIIDGIPEPHFDEKIAAFANQFSNPGLTMVAMTALAIQGGAGLIRGVYPDAAGAHRYLDVFAVLEDAAAALESVESIGDDL
jgi:hypothetical protein